MIMIRALGRLLTLLLLVALALAGLTVAIFSIGSDDSTVSLPALAGYLRLPELSDTVGGWLEQRRDRRGRRVVVSPWRGDRPSDRPASSGLISAAAP